MSRLAKELIEECFDVIEELAGSEQTEDVGKQDLERRYKIVVLRCLAFLVTRLSLLFTSSIVAFALLLNGVF